MSKTVLVISKWFAPLINKLTEVLPSVHFVDVQPSSHSALKEAEIIVGDFHLVGPYLYDLPKVKWIQGTSAGFDLMSSHIQKYNPPKFPITRTSGEIFGQLMGEYVIANIVFWERNYFKARENQKVKVWDTTIGAHDHRTFKDLKIGIFGIGAIGDRIGRKLNYLGATVYGFGRRDTIPLEDKEYSHIAKYFSRPNLSELLGSVDYVVNILPFTDETTNILGNGVLQNCKGKNVVFINIGRGNVIRETELIHALDEKWLSGAILDVFETEPLPRESRLWDFDNVFITPHISGYSRSDDIAANFKINFERFVNNQPLINEIDFVKGY